MKKEKIIKSYRKPQLSLICPPKMLRHLSPQQILTQNFHFPQYEQVPKQHSKNIHQLIGIKRAQALTCVDWHKRATFDDEQAMDKVRERERETEHLIEHRTQSLLKRKTSKQQHRRVICRNSPYVKNKEEYERILNNLKPVKGPTDSLMKQIKRHNDQNRKNAQNVLLATKDSFKQKIMKYSSRIGLRNNEKIFVMNSKDRHIREALQRSGWVQSNDLSSTFFHLKWVYTDCPTDYQKLQEGQFYNHFRNNQELTNKNLFRKNIWKSPSYLRPNHPSTFDLQLNGSQAQFQMEYLKYEHWKVLDRIAVLVEQYEDEYYRKLCRTNCMGIKYSCAASLNFRLERTALKQMMKSLQPKIFRQKGVQMQKQRQLRDFLYNFCFILLQFEKDKTTSSPSTIAEINNRLQSIKNWLRKLNESQFNLHGSWVVSQFEEGNHRHQKEKEIFCTVLLHDRFLLFLLMFLHRVSQQKFGHSFGTENWWIIKPAGVSRGTGIKIERDLTKIMNSKYGKVVQKYIERPLLLSCGRKFDIRQWVLVRSFLPLEAYIFKSCYCRFSASKYSSDSFHSLSVHLTNYSKQKQTFERQKNTMDSIKSEQELQKQMDGLTYCGKWARVKGQIKQQIIKSLKCCEFEIEGKPECFEVYGFDIIIDEDYRPWVLEVNLSPACEKRADFLETYLGEMADGIVDLVEGREIRNWERLPADEKYNQKIKNKKQYSRAEEQIAVRKIQRFYRKI